MVVRHNPRSFLTGDDPFLPRTCVESNESRCVEEFPFELRHEGFIGIPHGGIGMGLCIDAWTRSRDPRYPLHAEFKFGGSGVFIGDRVRFEIERDELSDGAPLIGRIVKDGDRSPYLRAILRSGARSEDSGDTPYKPPDTVRPLPFYRNCFVCGHHRTIPGLQRRFRVHANNGTNVTTSVWRSASEDGDRAKLFRINEDEIHPAVLVSIFDENTAWSGFMLTRACGLSVRMNFTVLRPVHTHEDLIFMGAPIGIRGNPKAPRFFKCRGWVLSMQDPTAPEVVAFGDGEWVVMNKYTEQIKENLLPENDWQWIFG